MLGRRGQQRLVRVIGCDHRAQPFGELAECG